MSIRNVLDKLNEGKQMKLFNIVPSDVEEEDELELPIKELVLNEDSVKKTLYDYLDGSYSQSSGRLNVWFTDKEEFLLTDGFHRLIEFIIDRKSVV